MSDPVIVTIIGGVQAVALALIAAWLKRSGDENHTAVQKSIEVVRQDVNGKMEKMQDVIAKASKAEGKLEGLAEAQQRKEEG